MTDLACKVAHRPLHHDCYACVRCERSYYRCHHRRRCECGTELRRITLESVAFTEVGGRIVTRDMYRVHDEHGGWVLHTRLFAEAHEAVRQGVAS